MLPSLFVILFFVLPQYVYSSCCRLPFTDGECRVNQNGPHRYQIMPDRRSGLVMESTECYINDFDSNYRKVIERKNYCNECPGLLIFHTNSSEIFLFPEYLERILEGRTLIQRKNVVILTTSLVGAYDLDFTLFSRYYASRPLNEVPSLYVDLQLPAFDSTKETQPILRLRLPNYNEDKESLSKINRQELIDPLDNSVQTTTNIHQLPYLYHFDMEKHRHPPNLCTLYDVQVSSSSLIWKQLGSEIATCHDFMPLFGRNRCYATGFTRLFCSIEENILVNDLLKLSSYLKTTNRVEHLTLAVTGGRHVVMSLNNNQMRPAEQVKILLVQGHLIVTDVNLNLPIRVEYGWDCNDFSLVVPAGFSATRYRRFDDENLSIYEGDSIITLPSCFRVIPSSAQTAPTILANTLLPFASPVEPESDGEPLEVLNPSEEIPSIIVNFNLTNTTVDNEQSSSSNYWTVLQSNSNLTYAVIVLLVLVALIPLCLGVFYRVYCNQNRKSKWTLEHGSQINPAFTHSKDDRTALSVLSYANNSSQTTDTPIRI